MEDPGALEVPTPLTRPLMRVRFEVAPTGEISASGPFRSVHRFTGGSFDGLVSGIVLPGGGDIAFVRTPDWIEIDASAVLRTEDGVNILLEYRGLWRAAPGEIACAMASPDALFAEEEHYLRTSARFDAGDTAHARLNGILALGIGRLRPGGIEHLFYEVL